MYIFKNAGIYTSEGGVRRGILVTEGKEIVYAGDETGAPALASNGRVPGRTAATTGERAATAGLAASAASAGSDATVYDLGGKTVLPGFIDSHVHPGACSRSTWHVRLPWTEDRDELIAFVKKYGQEHTKEEMPFIYFEYYPTAMFDENGPTREMLDEAISDRPVLCQDFGEHLCWVNSKMLELLGVDEDTPDPNSLEVFVRDEKGRPTGWIKEMAWLHFAENMYETIGWRPPEELTEERMRPFFRLMKESGITALFDAMIESDEQIRTVWEMDKAGELYLYYDAAVRFWKYEDLPEKIAKLREYQKRYGSEHIKLNTMKLFLDGTNESGNSASLHEHINDPGNYGEIMMETDELTQCFLLCNREGLDLHIHMVGDRAFRVGCDAVEAAQKEAGRRGEPWVCRPVFAHCEVVDPSDMERPARLGIFINWSCHWSGGYFGDEALNYYTEEKWRRMYQFNPMLESGAVLAFSSDVVTAYEMHRAYPFFGMQVAATRVDPEFPLDPDKYPGSMRPEATAKLNVETLLRGYTFEGARQLRWQDRMGSLEAGKLANFIVVDEDPLETPVERLSEITVNAVFFDGQMIHGSLESGGRDGKSL